MPYVTHKPPETQTTTREIITTIDNYIISPAFNRDSDTFCLYLSYIDKKHTTYNKDVKLVFYYKTIFTIKPHQCSPVDRLILYTLTSHNTETTDRNIDYLVTMTHVKGEMWCSK